MPKKKTYEIEIHEICLLYSRKDVSSAFKCLHLINLILTFMFPIKSQAFYDSIKA